MKILVLSQAYPNAKDQAQAFVHSRVKALQSDNQTVTVLNFSSANNYVFDGVEVISERCLSKDMLSQYEILVFQAPNIRNHLRFFYLYASQRPAVFVFHGHEAININKFYPANMRRMPSILGDLYDTLKIFVLKKTVKGLARKRSRYGLIFVSNWFKGVVESEWGLNFGPYKNTVIPNSVYPEFISNQYSLNTPKVADFITIRPNFDNEKYALDLVYQFASANPTFTFDIYGQGMFFKNRAVLPNIKVFYGVLPQKEIPSLLSKYRFAMMPTRLDAQGVMMCEMATFGIPVVTTDLPVCREVLSKFKNVYYLKMSKFNEENSHLTRNSYHCRAEAESLTYSPAYLGRQELDFYEECLRGEG